MDTPEIRPQDARRRGSMASRGRRFESVRGVFVACNSTAEYIRMTNGTGVEVDWPPGKYLQNRPIA
jgi:hypothetical protein